MNGFQKKQVLRALDSPEKLSDWEYDFVNSLAERYQEKPLSDNQNSILNRIAEKVG